MALLINFKRTENFNWNTFPKMVVVDNFEKFLKYIRYMALYRVGA